MKIQDAVSRLTNVSLLQSAQQSTTAAGQVSAALERVALIPAKEPGKGFLGALVAAWENFMIDLENRDRVSARRDILVGLKQHLVNAYADAGDDVRFGKGLRSLDKLQRLHAQSNLNEFAGDAEFLEGALTQASTFLKKFLGPVDPEVRFHAFETLKAFGYSDDLPFPTRQRIDRELLHALTEAKRNGARRVPVDVLDSIMTRCVGAGRAGSLPQSGATERLRAHQERQERLNPEATMEIESDDDEEVVSWVDGIPIYAEKSNDDDRVS